MSGKSLKRTAPLKCTPFKRVIAAKIAKSPARKAPMASRQRAVTAAEKALWDRLAREVGCIACMKDGRFNDHVSIHHIDGRTKPGCHELVLPLCAPHHQQDDTDVLQRVAVHPNKGAFEKLYGTQLKLLADCLAILNTSAQP
jgi:hypothetical protein